MLLKPAAWVIQKPGIQGGRWQIKEEIIYTKDQNLSSRKRKEIQRDWGCLIILPYRFIKYSLKQVGWDLELRDLIITYNLLKEHYDPLIEKRFYFKKKKVHS